MITRAMARPASLRVAYINEPKLFSRLTVLAAILACIGLMVMFAYIYSAQEDAKEQLLERLQKEKKIVEINKSLKMELAAITQKGYLEFAAKERLGLKRPTDEEVVVLR
jgi:hypothetical protein